MVRITARSETFLLSDYMNCPDGVDYTMYSRVIEKYEELSKTEMPIVEDIFQHIESYMIDDVIKDIRIKVASDNKHLTKPELEELTKLIASDAVYSLESGIEEEVIYILRLKNLCYRSFSMRGLGDEFGIINNPQQDIIMSLQEGSGLYGYYAED